MAKYFKEKEYRCKCGCGLSNMNPILLAKLDIIREHLGKPMVINSGCRCEKHNKAVGGVATSLHVASADKEASAVDISCTDKKTRFDIIKLAIENGITGIGVHKSFVHLSYNMNTKEGVFLY